MDTVDNTSKIEKPDFDQIASEIYYKWHGEPGLGGGPKDSMLELADTVWNSHVLPLLSQLQEMREENGFLKELADARKVSLDTMTSEFFEARDKNFYLREENERLKEKEAETFGLLQAKLNDFLNCHSELSSLKKENEELREAVLKIIKGSTVIDGVWTIVSSREMALKIESLIKP